MKYWGGDKCKRYWSDSGANHIPFFLMEMRNFGDMKWIQSHCQLYGMPQCWIITWMRAWGITDDCVYINQLGIHQIVLHGVLNGLFISSRECWSNIMLTVVDLPTFNVSPGYVVSIIPHTIWDRSPIQNMAQFLVILKICLGSSYQQERGVQMCLRQASQCAWWVFNCMCIKFISLRRGGELSL